MKRVWHILFWIVAIALVVAIVSSLGYRIGEAVFIGTLFAPCSLFISYYFSRYKLKTGKEYLVTTVLVIIGVIIFEVFLFIIAHSVICVIRYPGEIFYAWEPLPDLLRNPVFIALILAAVSIGYIFFKKWLDKKFPSEQKTLTFLSDRKPVSLMANEIIYVESNDSITIVYAKDGHSYRNKTPISQWEAILDDGFVRIHRSYLVNRFFITSADVDTVFIGEIELPISRKYKSNIIV